MEIKIKNINEALNFSHIAETFKEDVEVTDGRYIVDGKSNMGLLMIYASNKPLEVKIITNDITKQTDFYKAIHNFIVK